MRITAFFFTFFLFAFPALADGEGWNDALVWVREGKFAEAKNLAAENDLLLRFVTWAQHLENTPEIPFGERNAFIRQNPSFPYRNTLIQNAEKQLPKNMPNKELAAWFSAYPPSSPEGVSRAYETFKKLGKKEKAERLLREAYVTLSFDSLKNEQAFWRKHRRVLRAGDLVARFERLIRRGRLKEVRAGIPRLPKIYRGMLEAQIALRRSDKKAEKTLEKVAPSWRNHPPLLLAKAAYYRRTEQFDKAREVFKNPRLKKEATDVWKDERSMLVRMLLKAKKYAEAYALATEHPHPSGSAAAFHFEWMGAWIAEIFLKDDAKALHHMEALLSQATTLVSRSRVAYGMGTLLEKQGKKEEALDWFRKSAVAVTTFYGQLALKKLPPEEQTPYLEALSPEAENTLSPSLSKTETFAIFDKLADFPYREWKIIFAMKLIWMAKTREDFISLATYFYDRNQSEAVVHLSRQARLKGIELGFLGYPDLAVPVPKNPEKSLILSIIRQESSFNGEAVSPSNAVGLMQVMPGTAKEMCGRLKIKHSLSKLRESSEHNVKVGGAYLDYLLKRYDGSYILAIAAYNAGPTNVKRWIETYGNPEETNPLQWIESIPYNETRNYIQRVLENLTVYRYL